MAEGEPIPGRVEVMPDRQSALDLVAQGATVMRVENETMSAVALQRPREERAVLKRALDELDIVPALAERCFYSIPYKERRGGEERTVYVTGASIHTARNLMRRWGNCSAATRITAEDADKVVLAGVFVDLETNVRVERLFTVSKWQHRRNGPPVRVGAERLVQAVQAGASKAERNAIVAGLPDWLTQSYYDKARAIAAKEARSEGAVSKITAAFLAEGVSREMLEKHLGKRLDKLSPDDLTNLRGLLSALLENETTVEAVFGGGAKPDGSGGDGQGTDDLETVLAQGAKTTGGVEAPTVDVTQNGGPPGERVAAPPPPSSSAPAPTGEHVHRFVADSAGIRACEDCGELEPDPKKGGAKKGGGAQGRLV